MRPGSCRQADDRVADRRLACARFSDHAKDLAGIHAHVDAVDGNEHGLAARKFDGQVFDFKNTHAASPQFRVEGVAQPVAQKVDVEHQQRQCQAREDRDPPFA